MPTTTNFGWTTPADTDLVKDGAAAIRTLGNGIDTSLLDLKGGTTGQILSKASNTDLDYTWINNDQGDLTGLTAGVGITITSATGPVPTITNSSTDLITTAGDILYGTAADTVARLGIGTASQVLAVNSGATAPEWKTLALPATGWTLLNSGGTALTGATTITISSLSAKQLLILLSGVSSANASSIIQVRPNNLNTSIYDKFGIKNDIASTYAMGNFGRIEAYQATGGVNVMGLGGSSDSGTGYVYFDLCDQTGTKFYHSAGTSNSSATTFTQYISAGTAAVAAAITSISIVSSSGNFDAGTVYIYGAN